MGLPRVLASRLSNFINRYLTKPFSDPLKTQEGFFKELIARNQRTLFGKRHQFSQIQSIRQFQKSCPISTYEEFKPYIKLILEGNRQVLTTAKQIYWGQTSGTSGTPKIIPIVNQTFNSTNMSMLCSLMAYIAEDPRNNSRFLDGKSCFLAAYPLLRYEGKLPVGYGTGIFSSYRGGTQIWKYLLRSQLYIPIHLYRIKDVEKRNFQLAKEIIGKDFRQFSGVPSIVTNTLEKLLENASKLGIQAQKVADLFPEYHFSYFGGLSPKFYEKKLTALIGHKIDYREQLSATEGILGIQLQQEPGFTPMVNANFFEFIPVKSPADRCIINEIKKNEEYFICISSHNGLYAYNMGDIVKFISEDPPLFVFSSREGVVNLVDEKISQQDILYAIEHTNQIFKTILTDFVVVALRTPHNHYLFMLEFASKSEPVAYSEYLKALDTYMQEANEVYRYFRRDIGILKPPKLWILNLGTFEKVVNARAGRGIPREQTKIPHLSDQDALKREFESGVKLQIEM